MSQSIQQQCFMFSNTYICILKCGVEKLNSMKNIAITVYRDWNHKRSLRIPALFFKIDSRVPSMYCRYYPHDAVLNCDEYPLPHDESGGQRNFDYRVFEISPFSQGLLLRMVLFATSS